MIALLFSLSAWAAPVGANYAQWTLSGGPLLDTESPQSFADALVEPDYAGSVLGFGGRVQLVRALWSPTFAIESAAEGRVDMDVTDDGVGPGAAVDACFLVRPGGRVARFVAGLGPRLDSHTGLNAVVDVGVDFALGKGGTLLQLRGQRGVVHDHAMLAASLGHSL